MRKTTKRKIAIFIMMIMIVGLFTACSKKQTSSEAGDTGVVKGVNADETYYYICPLANLEYWQAHEAGLNDACAELGVTPKFVGDNGLDADAMCAIIETALNDPNCAGIIMQANFADAYEPYVVEAMEKGIPVCYQSVEGVENSARLCFLGTDYVEYGRIMMRQAAEATGGKGGVIFSSLLTSGNVLEENLYKGIKEEIENWPDMELVAEIDDNSDAAVAATKISAALLANDNVTVVIGGQSTSAIGAVAAIKEAGMSDKVQVISIDRDSATLEAIQNGDIYSTVAGKQYTEVYYGVKICYDYNHGSKQAFSSDDIAANMVIAPSFVDTGALIINKDNVDKFAGFSYADR